MKENDVINIFILPITCWYDNTLDSVKYNIYLKWTLCVSFYFFNVAPRNFAIACATWFPLPQIIFLLYNIALDFLGMWER